MLSRAGTKVDLGVIPREREPFRAVPRHQRSAGISSGWRGCESVGGKSSGRVSWSNPSGLFHQQTRKSHACSLQLHRAGLELQVCAPEAGWVDSMIKKIFPNLNMEKWAMGWEENWPDHSLAMLPRDYIILAKKAQLPSSGGTCLISLTCLFSWILKDIFHLFIMQEKSQQELLPIPAPSVLGVRWDTATHHSVRRHTSGCRGDFTGVAVPKKAPQINSFLQNNLFHLQKNFFFS